ncbi:PDZ domain-containing protein 8 [Chytriomyces hyalinus]|nr:PDZ domain-containing protein 8 [Chytriomyces hyalinus]
MSQWHLFGPHADVYVKGIIWGGGLILTVQLMLIVAVAVMLFDPTRTRTPPIVARSDNETQKASNANRERENEREKERDAENEHWPEDIVAYLMDSLTPDDLDSDQPHSLILTLNVLVHRFFLSLRDSSLFTDRMCLKLGHRLNTKLASNSFVSHVRLHDIRLGDNVPKLHAVRLLKGITDDLAVALEVDLTYQGGASVGIETTLTAGVNIPVRVSISSLSGKLRVRCPAIGYPDMYSIAFVEDPGVSFKVDSQITVRENELLKGMVNSVLAEIIRRVFLEMWVLPGWRTFFLPLMIPGPEEESARMDEVNSVSKTNRGAKFNASITTNNGPTLLELKTRRPTHKQPGQVSKSLAKRASSLLSSSGIPPAPSSLKLLDCVTALAKNGDTSAPLSLVLDASVNSISLDAMENAVTSAFLGIACDVTGRTASGPIADGILSVALSSSASSSASKLGSTSSSSSGSSTANLGSAGGPVQTEWKVTKNRPGVLLGRCRKSVEGVSVGDVFWAKLIVNCNPETVFVMLSNPEHFRVMEDSFVDSVLLKQYDDHRSVRLIKYNLGKGGAKEFPVFEVKRRLDPKPIGSGEASTSSESKAAAYIVITRSVAAYSEDTNAGSILDLDHHSLRNEPQNTDANADIKESLPRAGTDYEDFEHRNSPDPLVAASESITKMNSTSKAPSGSTALAQDGATESNVLLNRSGTASAPPSRRASPERGAPLAAVTPLFPPSRVSSLPPASPQLTVYLQGYLIESNPQDSNTCTVTLLSQLSPDMNKLETNFTSARKLKSFIEEYVNHENALAGDNVASSSRAKALSEVGFELKSFVNSTAEYFSQRRKQAIASGNAKGWGGAFGVVPTGVSGVGGSPASGFGMISGSSHAVETDEDSSEYEDTAENLHAIPSSFSGRAGNQADSASIMSRGSTIGSERGSKKSDLMSSAAALARNVSKRRSLGFLTRAGVLAAGGMQAVQDEEDGGQGVKEPFSIGVDPDPALFVTRQILGRDIVRIEIPFKREDYADAVELAWEFITLGEASIVFGLMFRPDPKADSSKSVVPLFPESTAEPGTRQVVPYGSITTAGMPSCRGNLCLSSFVSGTFVFLWDNSTGVKKVLKEFRYRQIFRPFQVPRAIDMVSPVNDTVGEFGFGMAGKGQHCTGVAAEVTINRKSLYRAFLVYDQSLESFSDSGEPETLTFLTWDFSTNGLEVAFGVSYFASIADAVATGAVSGSLFGHLDSKGLDTPNTSPTYDIKMSGMDEITAAASDAESQTGNLSMAHTPEMVEERGGKTKNQVIPPSKPARGGGEHPASSETYPHLEKQSAPSAPPPKPSRRVLNIGSPSSSASPVTSPVPTPTQLASLPPSGEKLPLAARLEALTNKADAASSQESHLATDSSAQLHPQSTSPQMPPQLFSQTHPHTSSQPSSQMLPQQLHMSDHLSQSSGSHSRNTSNPLRHNRPFSVPIVPLTKAKSIAGSTVSGAVPIPGQNVGGNGGKGVYAFVWDNTTSMVLPKVVSFRVGLVTTLNPVHDLENAVTVPVTNGASDVSGAQQLI